MQRGEAFQRRITRVSTAFSRDRVHAERASCRLALGRPVKENGECPTRRCEALRLISGPCPDSFIAKPLPCFLCYLSVFAGTSILPASARWTGRPPAVSLRPKTQAGLGAALRVAMMRVSASAVVRRANAASRWRVAVPSSDPDGLRAVPVPAAPRTSTDRSTRRRLTDQTCSRSEGGNCRGASRRSGDRPRRPRGRAESPCVKRCGPRKCSRSGNLELLN